jgi:hypothetical protein
VVPAFVIVAHRHAETPCPATLQARIDADDIGLAGKDLRQRQQNRGDGNERDGSADV